MEDHELLRAYWSERSESAFAELVNRRLALVYSTALRVLGQRQLAEEVAQMVFLKLARKAAALGRKWKKGFFSIGSTWTAHGLP